jgi:protein-L-isoaspartate(D-aspartate) O-methyltransferase
MLFQGTQSHRDSLVAELAQRGFIETKRVAEAFRRVPREAFVRDLRPEQVYMNAAIATRWGRAGQAISSSSEPSIMARMLEMLRIDEGMNVFEVGAATGYNAALQRELVGPSGA